MIEAVVPMGGSEGALMEGRELMEQCKTKGYG